MNSILLLRLLLAFLVIFSHSWWVPTGGDAGEPLMQWTRGQMNSGALAVDAFFVLSGLLVTASWYRSPHFSDYLMKRMLRIYPAFIVLCLFQAFILVPLLDKDTHPVQLRGIAEVHGFALSLGGFGRETLPGFPVFSDHPFPALNASLWTIRPEFLCYLFLGFLGAVHALNHRGIRLGLFGVSWLLYTLQPDWEWHDLIKGALGTFHYWPRFLVFFLAGVVLHDLGPAIPRSAGLRGCLAIALLASMRHPTMLRLALPTLGAALLYLACFSPLLTRLSSRLTGDLSYGVYLYGFPCQQLLVSATGTQWNPYLFTGAAFLLTLLPAALSWWWIEKPALALRNRIAARQAPAG
ncbi:MAG: acyltransferase [Verrucomicrobiales bacterium]|nr:acyltransferase [Verrucomicrobiales bacterium]